MKRRYFENPALWGRTTLTLVQNQVLNVLKRFSQELPEGSRVAELGCGDGIILEALQEDCSHLSFQGVDLSYEAVRRLPSPPLSRCVADLVNLPFRDGFFDLTYCLDVLEHVIPAHLQKVVLEVHRVSRGPVLMVTPFLESDAVRTVCPHCGCVFSPYYHHNRFGLDTWDPLIAPLHQARLMEYLPFGLPKPHLPLGIGLPLVSSGNLAAHHHETICPQCDTVFSRSASDPGADITMLLAPFAARNPREFGWVYEELGILTVPRQASEGPGIIGPSGGILIQTKAPQSSWNQEKALLEIGSAYEIDFDDPPVLSLNTDLFRSPAYVVDNGHLRRKDGEHGISWQWAADGGDAEGNPLRLVFPPLAQEDPVRMELSFSTESPGALQAMLYALPPKPPVVIGAAVSGGSRLPAVLRFDLPPDDQHVTPFGLLVDLVWNPSELGEHSPVYIKINGANHIDYNRAHYLLTFNIVNEWPLEMSWFHQASIQFQNKLVRNIIIKYDYKEFNFIGLCPLYSSGSTRIKLPLFEHMMELGWTHVPNPDQQRSKPYSGSYRSGKKVYDFLFDRITRVDTVNPGA
jgi:ubiquinone/menaquinone biosynthesis C-methylase UbiE